MKTDKIFFAVACLGLGYLGHTSMNINSKNEQIPEEISSTMPKMKPQLAQDTLDISKCIPKDSTAAAKDSLKMIKKVMR